MRRPTCSRFFKPMNKRKRKKGKGWSLKEKSKKKTFKEEGQSIHINAGNIMLSLALNCSFERNLQRYHF